MSLAARVVSAFRHHLFGAGMTAAFLIFLFFAVSILNWVFPTQMAGVRSTLGTWNDAIGSGIEHARPRSLAMAYRSRRQWVLDLRAGAPQLPARPAWPEIEARLREGLPWDQMLRLISAGPSPSRAFGSVPGFSGFGEASSLAAGSQERLAVLLEPISIEFVRDGYVGGLREEIWKEDYLTKRFKSVGFGREEWESEESTLLGRLSESPPERELADRRWSDWIAGQRKPRPSGGLSVATRANELDGVANRLVGDFRRLDEAWARFEAARLPGSLAPAGLLAWTEATIRATWFVLVFVATSHWSQAVIGGLGIALSAILIWAMASEAPLLAILLFLPLAELFSAASWVVVWSIAELSRHVLVGFESLLAVSVFTAPLGQVVVASVYDGFKETAEELARKHTLG